MSSVVDVMSVEMLHKVVFKVVVGVCMLSDGGDGFEVELVGDSFKPSAVFFVHILEAYL